LFFYIETQTDIKETFAPLRTSRKNFSGHFLIFQQAHRQEPIWTGLGGQHAWKAAWDMRDRLAGIRWYLHF
jgi:hypothetical protein